MDLQAYARAERCEPKLSFRLRMFLVTPGFQFVLSHRLQEGLVAIPFVGRIARRLVWWLTCLVFGAEIAMAATIEGGLYIPHPYGIVIGRSRIGRNVSIMQNVTVGTKSVWELAVPEVGDDVVLGAGAVVLGQVSLGNGSALGANAVVLSDLPAGSVAVGVPARVVATREGF
ncbi:serine O-acetyltransferase EpsC [Bosea sp. ASV33]|uniref:serine O-acetyltransferase EpsC n=1 Tax=Bosea sp. ASV33 TaxID=2795106 RepID=UPI0018ED3366|nr:serine O-acetyltransferase EpsC [Bosea sp. ASV33]